MFSINTTSTFSCKFMVFLSSTICMRLRFRTYFIFFNYRWYYYLLRSFSYSGGNVINYFRSINNYLFQIEFILGPFVSITCVHRVISSCSNIFFLLSNLIANFLAIINDLITNFLAHNQEIDYDHILYFY